MTADQETQLLSDVAALTVELAIFNRRLKKFEDLLEQYQHLLPKPPGLFAKLKGR